MKSDRREALERFIAEEKFKAEGYYPGAVSEADRVMYQSSVNALARRLIARLNTPLSKTDVLNEFKTTLKDFEDADSEDKDQMLSYLEQVMDIFGIQSSDGMLNNWRYGFDPGQAPDARNSDALAHMNTEERALLAKLEAVHGDAALPAFTKLLGPPSTTAEGMQIWFLDEAHTSIISLMTDPRQPSFAWLNTGKFAYTHKF